MFLKRIWTNKYMTESIELFNEEAFIKDFIKKLESILQKAPIQARAKIIKSRVEITVVGFDTPIIYNFNYNLSVKENIYLLKEKLYKERYPTIDIITRTQEKYTPTEIEQLISEGLSLSEALLKFKLVETKEVYKISRVLIPKDQIFIKNINDETDEKMYRMKMPLSIFLKRMRSKWTKEETSAMFEKNAEFIRIIYPLEVWKELNTEKQRVEVVSE